MNLNESSPDTLDCKTIIERVYNHPQLNQFLAKINPESIRDDLRQEIALYLLEQPCDKIARIWADNGLLAYAIKAIWIMATCKSPFSRKYNPDDVSKLAGYLYTTYNNGADISGVEALQALNDKPKGTAKDYHEFLIFTKYVELRSEYKVASFYGIPRRHVHEIVTKVRKELKQVVKNA